MLTQGARRKGGLARAAQTDMSELGRRGGLATVERYGKSYMAEIGRMGGLTYVERYGARKLVEMTRQHRLDNPSALEQVVLDVLVGMGYVEDRDFEREGYFFPRSRNHHYTGDFVFRSRKKAILVDGHTWHTNGNLQGNRAEKDAAVRAFVQNQ